MSIFVTLFWMSQAQSALPTVHTFSYARKELQAVDAVAWAFFQKYERGDPRFYELIAARVIVEDVITQKKWKI